VVAIEQEKARLQAAQAAPRTDTTAPEEDVPTRREGTLSPEERHAHWERLDAELEERQRRARQQRAKG
jgi:hypothetical protein